MGLVWSTYGVEGCLDEAVFVLTWPVVVVLSGATVVVDKNELSELPL